MFETIWNTVSGWIGDTLSSMIESILNATIFRLFYYLERALCWIISILTKVFEVFAGLDRVSYDGEPDYLINIFFNNKAINNIYWGMAVIGVIMVFIFTIWAVVRKMADVNGKQQQSMGEIIGSAAKSFFLIVSMTLIINIVLSFTNVLMEQINFIFNNAYHLEEPVEREFSEEEYAAMGRVLSTIGNYSIVQTSSNRYNLNLCYNDIRSDMYYLQQQGIFEYSYFNTDKNGQLVESWQSVLSKIAKSADLSLDAKADVYNQDIANSITYAMNYLQNTSNPTPVPSVSRNYIDDNDIHLDRLVFLMGTTNAAKNEYYNQKPSMEDAVRGPYYYNQGRSLYSYDNVTDDFHIGFRMDYLVVWLLSMALIYDLVVIILNCVTRIFNMLFLYLIAPPVIAATPLDNGGKFKQWSIAFIVQSFSVFGTVIAMRLLTIFLPIVISPTLVLFENQPTLNMFAKFILVYGGFEAAKKSTALLTGILADSAGWQSIQAGDMSGTASQALGKVGGAVRGAAGLATGAAGKVLGGAGSVVGFAAKPLTNKISAPFKNAAEKWSKLGTGSRQEKALQDSIQQKIAQGKAEQSYADQHPEDAKYLGLGGKGGEGSGGSGSGSGSGSQPQNQNNQNNQNNNNNDGGPGGQGGPGGNPQNQNNQNNQNDGPGGPGGQGGGPAVPPPLPNRGNSNEAPAVGGGGNRSLNNMRAQYGFGGGAGGGGQGGGPQAGGRQGGGMQGGGGARQGAAPQQGAQAPQGGYQMPNNQNNQNRPESKDDFNVGGGNRPFDLDGAGPGAGAGGFGGGFGGGGGDLPADARNGAGFGGEAPQQGGGNQQQNYQAPQGGYQGGVNQQYQAPPQQNYRAPQQGGGNQQPNYQAPRQGNQQQYNQGQRPAQPQQQYNARPQQQFQAPPQGGYQAPPQQQYQAPPQPQFQAQPQPQYQAPPQNNAGPDLPNNNRPQ